MRKESVLLCAILALAGAWGCSRPEPPRISVLLISIDTLRADALGSYGAPSGQTPHLDELALSGIVFENAISQAPATGPSFASVMTSLYPPEHGVMHSTMPLESQHLTMAEIFQDAGYRTGAFVSTSILRSDYGFAQGFDLYDDKMHGEYAPSQHERDARFTTDRALLWLANQPEKPFFLWVHYFDAHAPYRAHPDPGGEPSEAAGSQAGSYEALRGIEARQSEEEVAGALPEIRRLYAAEVSQIDQQIGRLIAALDDLGQRDRVLISVGADHGEELFDHGFFHGHFLSLSQSVLHVPLIFSFPGRLPAGRRVGEVVENVDILPTILAVAEVRDPGNRSGRDLSSLFLADPHPGDEPPPSSRLAWSVREPYADMPGGQAISVRNQHWKTIFYTKAPDELYDLQTDPGEKLDLASKEPERVATFRSRLDAWLKGEPFTTRDQADLNPEDYEVLKALGYIQE